MRARSMQIVSVLFALLLISALASGCQQQGAEENGGGTPTNGESSPTADTLELDAVTQWASSAHSRPVVFAAEEEGCKNCHDGLTFTETGGGFEPRMTGAGEATGSAGTSPTVGDEAEAEERNWVVAADCRTCHSGAGVEIAKEGSIEGVPNVETAEGGRGALCMSCHNGWHEAGAGREGNAAAPHYSIQTDMLYAVNTLQVSETATAESTATAGEDEDQSPHLKVADTCVGCHMRGADGAVSHTFRVENAEGCQQEGCHDEDMTEGGTAPEDFDGDGTTETYQVEVEGLLESLKAAILKAAGSTEIQTQGGDVVFVGGTVNTDDAAYKAAYNYFYVDKDSSRGIHNPEFTVKLLQDSIAGLEP